MTDENMRAAAVAGLADAIRHPTILGVILIEILVIAGLAWIIISDSRAERETHAIYVQELHAELVECHREKK